MYIKSGNRIMSIVKIKQKVEIVGCSKKNKI